MMNRGMGDLARRSLSIRVRTATNHIINIYAELIHKYMWNDIGLYIFWSLSYVRVERSA